MAQFHTWPALALCNRPTSASTLAFILALSLTVTVSSTHTLAADSLQSGIAQYQRGNIKQALAVFERLSAQNPQREDVLTWTAKALQKQGGENNIKRSQALFERALAINPNNVEALSSLGETLSWSSDTRERAITLLQQAHTLKPNDTLIQRHLVEALTWNTRYSEAYPLAQPLAAGLQKDRRWQENYAQILANTGNAAEAVRIYKEDLQADTTSNTGLRIEYAKALLKNNDREGCQAVYDWLKNSNPNVPSEKRVPFVVSLGGLSYDLGLYDDSLLLDRSIVDLLSGEDQRGIQLRIARALGKSGHPEEAVDAFYQLYQARKLTASEVLEMTDLALGLDPFPKSIGSEANLESILREAYQNADENKGLVALRLGRLINKQNGRTDEALTFYQEGVRQCPLSEVTNSRKEYLDFLKFAKDQEGAGKIDAAFQQLLAENPQDNDVQSAYAEYLSLQPGKRKEALLAFVELIEKRPELADALKEPLEKTLIWQNPDPSLIPTYQAILNRYPESRGAQIALAKAYQKDPKRAQEGVRLFRGLVELYPDDPMIKQEWVYFLAADDSRRKESLIALKALIEKNPDDLSMKILYGKLLSYEGKYAEAMRIFNDALTQEPGQKDALLGKGYTLLFNQKPLAAKKLMLRARELYPNDWETTLGLAETERALGRYDKAFDLVEELKRLQNGAQSTQPESQQPEKQQEEEPNTPPASSQAPEKPAFIRCDYQGTQPKAPVTYDFTIAPDTSANRAEETPTEMSSETDTIAPALSIPEYNPIAERERAQQQALLNRPNLQAGVAENRFRTHGQKGLGEINLQLPVAQSKGLAQLNNAPDPLSPPSDLITGSYGEFTKLDYDTNPYQSLGGLGRFKYSPNWSLEEKLRADLRPMIRSGYQFFVQDGERTTTRMRGSEYPSQMALSLTPQLRVRGGFSARNLYLVRSGVDPSGTAAYIYSMGGTYKPADRVTLDGDLAITDFDQSDSVNVTYQSSIKFDITDEIKLRLGGYRNFQENSLLSYAGLRPSRGPFRGQLLGQARENMFFAELNTRPFQNVDFNLGYDVGFVEGSRIPDNFKNQAFLSTGYTAHYAKNHYARIGYNLLFFSYDKNATLGYFDIDDGVNTRRPLVSLNPLTLAPSGTVFGGYFSPSQFFLNSFRLDLRGSLFNKFIDYKLGGAIGIQSTKQGSGIHEPNPNAFAASFDGSIFMNFTDWLTTYVAGDYLDGGGLFNRWRFGGGVILRPNIPSLSPVFKKS